MRRGLLSSFLLGISLLAPVVAVQAQERHDEQQTQRYYDRQGKDWHEWNSSETKYYQQYNEQNHRDAKDFKRLSRKQQSDYFRWRHQHHDGDSH